MILSQLLLLTNYILFSVLAGVGVYVIGGDIYHLMDEAIKNLIDPTLTYNITYNKIVSTGRLNGLTDAQIAEIWKKCMEAYPRGVCVSDVYNTYNIHYPQIPRKVAPNFNTYDVATSCVILPLDYYGAYFGWKIDLNHPSVTSYWEVSCITKPAALQYLQICKFEQDVTRYNIEEKGFEIDVDSLRLWARSVRSEWILRGYENLFTLSSIKTDDTFDTLTSVYKDCVQNRVEYYGIRSMHHPRSGVFSSFPRSFKFTWAESGLPNDFWLLVESREGVGSAIVRNVIHSGWLGEVLEESIPYTTHAATDAVNEILTPVFPDIGFLPSNALLELINSMSSRRPSSSEKEFLDIYNTLLRVLFRHGETFLCCHVDTSLIPNDELSNEFKKVMVDYFA